MNVTVEDLAPCRKLLRVEVESEKVDATFQEITSEFQKQASLPGFRPGKAPREMVTKRYNKEISDEVKRKLIGDSYREALSQKNLNVITHPDIEEIQFGAGQALQFAATVETEPQFEMPEYHGIPVKKELAVVTDEDVERALNVLREQRVQYNDVARPIQAGDFIVINYTGTSEGKPLTEIAPTARGLTQQNGFWVEVKPDSFIPGFADQLVGMEAGHKKTVEVTFPQDFVAPALSGRQGQYDVEVVQVKEKVLPELNDEFAKSFGAEDVEKLKNGVREDLARELEFKQSRAIRNQIIRHLLETIRFDLPESAVASETRNVVYDIVRENQQRGVSREMIEQQKDEIYAAANHSAKDRVRISFILGKVAEKEKIQVTNEELSHRIILMAQQYQMPPEKLAKQLRERNAIGDISDEILSGKVLAFLEEKAKVEEVPAGSLAKET